jgi:hypothetical protein
LFIEGQKCPHEYYGTTILPKLVGRNSIYVDNVGFKVGGTVFAARLAYWVEVQQLAGTPSTEILISAAGPYTIGCSWSLKFSFVVSPHMVVRLALAELLTLTMFVLLPWDCVINSAQAPTFFSLWIGNNDVLGYATTGDGSNPLLLLQVQQVLDLMLL